MYSFISVESKCSFAFLCGLTIKEPRLPWLPAVERLRTTVALNAAACLCLTLLIFCFDIEEGPLTSDPLVSKAVAPSSKSKAKLARETDP